MKCIHFKSRFTFPYDYTLTSILALVRLLRISALEANREVENLISLNDLFLFDEAWLLLNNGLEAVVKYEAQIIFQKDDSKSFSYLPIVFLLFESLAKNIPLVGLLLSPSHISICFCRLDVVPCPYARSFWQL